MNKCRKGVTCARWRWYYIYACRKCIQYYIRIWLWDSYIACIWELGDAERVLFSLCKKRVEERNEVIQLVPFYETEDSVRKSLSEGQTSIDLEKWEKQEKSLIIVDSLKNFFGNVSLESEYDSNKNLVDRAKTMGKKASQSWEMRVPFHTNTVSMILWITSCLYRLNTIWIWRGYACFIKMILIDYPKDKNKS